MVSRIVCLNEGRLSKRQQMNSVGIKQQFVPSFMLSKLKNSRWNRRVTQFSADCNTFVVLGIINGKPWQNDLFAEKLS